MTTSSGHPQRPEPCEHAWQEPRRRVLRNGTTHIIMQCLECGSQVRPVRRDEVAERTAAARNVPFDQELLDREMARREAAWREWHQAQSQAWHRERSREVAARREEYAAYLASEAWQRRRLRRLMLDGHRCQAVLTGCDGHATEVHHLTYAHVFNEPLFDLVSVCASCHRAISAMDQQRLEQRSAA